jgi:vitamin B12 transporter
MFRKIGGLFAVLALFLGYAAPLPAQDTDSALDTIVVSASRYEETLKSVTGSVTVISQEDIQKSSASNVADILAQQGFGYVGYGDSKYIQIRGISSTTIGAYDDTARVLVLIDGRRVASTRANVFGLSNVERIEVVRGPSAVQYGPAAAGGVINIITKKGKQNEFHLSAETGIGSWDSYKEDFSVSGGFSGFDFSAGITYSGQNKDNQIYGGHTLPGTRSPDNTQADIDIGYTFLEKHRIGINYYYSNAHFSAPDQWSVVSANPPADPGIYNQRYIDFRTDNVAFSYTGASPNDMFDWTLRYSLGESTEKKYYTDDKIKTKGIQAQFGYNSNYLDADIGIDYNSYAITALSVYSPPYYLTADYKTTDFGVYLASKIKLLDDRLFISLGGRWDKYTQDQHMGVNKVTQRHFSPSIGIAYLPIPELKLRVNYSQGFILPSASQIAGFNNGQPPGQYNAYYDPNPNLKPEEPKTLEFGIDYDYRYINASLTYFQTEYANKIVSRENPSAGQYHYQFQNLTKAQINGFEFSMKFDIGEALGYDFTLEPRVNLTYLTKYKNYDTTPSRFLALGITDLPEVSKYNLSYGVTFIHPGADLKVDLNGVYLGKQVTTYWEMGYIPHVINYTPGTTTVDLSIEKGIYTFGENGEGGKLSLKVAINNMFDNKNQTYYDYPGPGRNFYLGLKYEL